MASPNIRMKNLGRFYSIPNSRIMNTLTASSAYIYAHACIFRSAFKSKTFNLGLQILYVDVGEHIILKNLLTLPILKENSRGYLHLNDRGVASAPSMQRIRIILLWIRIRIRIRYQRLLKSRWPICVIFKSDSAMLY